MFCSNCGNSVNINETVCPNCGFILNQNINNNYSKQNSNTKYVLIGILIGLIILGIILLVMFLYKNNNEFYISDESYGENDYVTDVDTTSNVNKNPYSTVIVYDNRYEGISINRDKDAYDLIKKDSVSQKDKCPSKIKKIENNIIKKYNITAVNLCEMDYEYSKELEKVLDKIYKEYPMIREDLTNITLVNASYSEDYIAAFMPYFDFATSDSIDGFPMVVKTQILLNSKYYLNLERMKNGINSSVATGHFPENSSIYSPLAHEMGHYLSYLTLMKKYNLDSALLIDGDSYKKLYDLMLDFSSGDNSLEMIKEAYENYNNDGHSNIPFDEWRNTISNYAVAKDNKGDYIYDETIAEAFHDVYLNDDNAALASKYIVKVLKKELESR